MTLIAMVKIARYFILSMIVALHLAVKTPSFAITIAPFSWRPPAGCIATAQQELSFPAGMYRDQRAAAMGDTQGHDDGDRALRKI